MNKELLKKYIRGACTGKEAEKVIQWINSDNFDQDLLKNIEQDLQESIDLKDNNGDSGHLYLKIQQVYSKEQLERSRFSQKKQSYNSTFLKIAASVLLLLSSTFLVLNYVSREEEQASFESDAEVIVKENDRGRKSTIFLPDGSVVYLNSASSIQYDESSFTSKRVTFLEGEGFFEVAKDSVHPFKVITNNLEVTALGTAFNIDSYQEEKSIVVSLISGKILIENYGDDSLMSSKELFLNPGQEVNFIKKDQVFSKISSFNPKETYGWKDGILYFNNANLSDVLQKLERWFDVDFEMVNKNPFPWRYTAQFHNQNLKSILESLSFSQNFKYEVKEKKVIIEFESG